MKKRLELDFFLEDLTAEELKFLKDLRKKAIDVGEEKSFGSVHECGHGEGKKCKDKEDI